MNSELELILKSLEQFGRENDENQTDRQHKMLDLERDTAALIHILVQASRRQNILEIGTSNGYSTLWLADAARSLPSARLISIERNGTKIQIARQNLRRAGLEHLVTLVEGEASDIVNDLPGPYDCVFFDADRTSAPHQLRVLLPKMQTDVLLLCDNVLSHPLEVAEYLAAVKTLPDFASIVVPIGKGLHIAFRGGPRTGLSPRGAGLAT